ncbi:MAG: glycosyltransferase, partial [Candidatus Caldarchaeum sp.]
MKPKIGLFVASLGGGGAERVMVTIANHLARRAYPTQLVITKPDLTYAKELSPEVQLINLNTYRMTRTVLPLARYFRVERPDAVLSTLAEANIVAILARMIAGFPSRLVVREANTPSQQLLQHPHWKKRFTGKILRQIYLRADAIVAVSYGVYRDLVEGMRLPVSKVHLIRNPVPLTEIHQKMRQPVEHPWFAEDAPPVILSVGRLETQKDYPTLIRAFARARESIEARLVILGEGSERHALQQLIQSLGLEGSVDLPG